MQAWEPWNPAAGFFHHATRDVKYVDADVGEGTLNRKRKATRPPSPIKKMRGARQTRLPKPEATDPFTSVLLERRTWRHFSKASVSLADVGALLHLTAGVQRWAPTAAGRVPLKTSPSGGATHPGELYAVALNVQGLSRGLYHYRADTNALEFVKGGATPADVERYLPTQWWYRRAALVVFFAAVVDRSLWRYAYARAYRALLIEAGHQCQTFCLTATALGLAPFCCMALADSVIEKDFGMDGISETVLYAAGVGAKPAGLDWAPSPPDEAWPGGPPKSRAGSRPPALR
jgi:SagB-type dehydrogenase family enzyme